MLSTLFEAHSKSVHQIFVANFYAKFSHQNYYIKKRCFVEQTLALVTFLFDEV